MRHFRFGAFYVIEGDDESRQYSIRTTTRCGRFLGSAEIRARYLERQLGSSAVTLGSLEQQASSTQGLCQPPVSAAGLGMLPRGGLARQEIAQAPNGTQTSLFLHSLERFCGWRAWGEMWAHRYQESFRFMLGVPAASCLQGSGVSLALAACAPEP